MAIEKTALKSMFLRKALVHRRTGGTKAVVDFLRSHKHPTHNLPIGKNSIPKYIDMPDSQKGRATLSRGVKTSIGNMAENFHVLTKDIKGKGFFGGIGQSVKNTGELIARQVKGDTIKEVSGVTEVKDGVKFLKSKNPFAGDRRVLSETGRGTVLVNKRKAMLPISVALGGSGLSVGAFSYALSDKEKPKSKRLQNAARDTALFTAGIPIGIAGSVMLGSKEQQNLKNKNKNKIGE